MQTTTLEPPTEHREAPKAPVTELTFEIVPKDLGLSTEATHTLELSFLDFFQRAAKWKAQAELITSPKLARAARLEIKSLRVAAEKKRKELKEDALRYGKAVDGANNILLAMIVPIEQRLEEIEKEEERKEAARIAALDASRKELLAPYWLQSVGHVNYGAMSQSDFDALLADAKALHEARLERERKEAEALLARQVAEAQERERIRLENERLLKEAAEREAAAKVEREKADAEKKALEAKLAQERREAEAQAEKVRLEAETAARIAAEKARVEREASEAKAAAELAKQKEEARRREHEANEKARAEREALEKKAAEERAAREKIEAEQRAAKEAEEQRLAAEAAKAAAAATAPDKQKLIAFAERIHGLALPEMKTEEGKKALTNIAAKRESFVQWIIKNTTSL